MFYPDGGGQDFRFARNSPEANGIEIWDDNNSCNIVFPKALHFEAFPSNDEWNYFVLELKDKDNIFESESCYEELVEDIPAHYVIPTYYQYGVYDYDKGNSYPDGYRLVARYTRGKILFVLKNGPYNHINGTYDARHNLCSCEEFREYICDLIENSQKYKNRSYFYDSRFANRNPFLKNDVVKEKSTMGVRKLMGIRTISPQLYFTTKFDFSGIKEVTNDEYAKYYISFHPNDGTISFNSKEIILCKDGYLHELDNELENILYFNSREFAHKVKELCNQQLLPRTGETVLSYFTVNILGLLKPEHVFSKNEIARVMREADDRKQSILVIDEKGYPRIISNNELDIHSFPVHHERWNAGNLYVGKYSKLSTLDETYISSLQGWLLYLQTNSSVYVDYLNDNQDENKLLDEINTI